MLLTFQLGVLLGHNVCSANESADCAAGGDVDGDAGDVDVEADCGCDG